MTAADDDDEAERDHDVEDSEFGRLKPSSHAELQPDIRVRCQMPKATCAECGGRAIHQYQQTPLCRAHALRLQTTLNRLRGESSDPRCYCRHPLSQHHEGTDFSAGFCCGMVGGLKCGCRVFFRV